MVSAPYGSRPRPIEYAKMAKACYNRDSAQSIFGGWGIHAWYDIKVRSDALTLASFTNDSDVVLAFGGTDPSNINHIMNDIKLGVGAMPAAASKAEEIFQLVLELVAAEGKRISLVGHSLGGAFAQYVGYYYRVKTGTPPVYYVTFCAPGITGFLPNLKTSAPADDPGINYYVQNDLVHKFGGEKTGKRVDLGLSPLSFPECHKMTEVLKLVAKKTE